MILIKKEWLENLQKNKYLQLLPDFKEEKTRKFITLALTLVTLCFFGIFAIGPTTSTIFKLRKELEDNKLIESQLKQKINNLSVLQEKYAELQADLPDIYSAVPKTPEVATLIGQIEQLAKENNVNITNTQTLQVEAITNKLLKKASSFNFVISVEGSYVNINQFLNSLNNMQRIVSLENISFTNTTENNIVKLSVKGTAYFKN